MIIAKYSIDLNDNVCLTGISGCGLFHNNIISPGILKDKF